MNRFALTALLGAALVMTGLTSGCSIFGFGAARGTDPSTAAAIAKASVGSHRSEKNIARNVYRHPVETLSFFGLRSNMVVVEALPGGLWYSEILAPVLLDEGQYIAAGYDVSLPDPPEYRMRGHKYMLERFATEAEVFGPAKIATLTAPTSIDLGSPGSADMVLTFRSNHGWIRDDAIESVYAAFFEVLKSGGVLGVVQHRAGKSTDTSVFNGYVSQDRLIKLITAEGFVLEAVSEINANPKDKANYEGGVWTLPPSLRLGDENRAEYLVIGESDRMTLRFRKP
jgi:predicted methyltransferase